MKKIVFAAFFMAAVMPAAAQDTYESARLLGEDLNGTARYVGMGGAMEALGADISTIGSNPAGIGLFRHSMVSMSLGLVSQQDAQKFDGLGKTNMSFDQIGFVYSTRMSSTSYLNFAFNYHKSRNFDQILSAANKLRDVSSNALSYNKAARGNVMSGGYDLDFNNDGDLVGWETGTSDYRSQTFSTLDYLNANAVLLDADYENLMDKGEPYIFDLAADEFAFDRSHRGWINDYDFNISGNENDRFFWGVTIGLHSVNYKGYSQYTEGMVTSTGRDAGVISYGDERKIKGFGGDVTAGIIFRPVETSPFRIGLTISTPTYYDLTTNNYTEIVNGSDYGCYDYGSDDEEYKFKLFTPWKFGLSLGHTVGNNLALGASYEFSDYGATRNRINDGWDRYLNQFDVIKIVMTDYKPNELTYLTNTTQNRVAVFSEIYYPNEWHLYIDDKEASIGRVNYLLRAAVIPAGDHTIRMTFIPHALQLDKWSVAILILCILLSLGCLSWPLYKKYIPYKKNANA